MKIKEEDLRGIIAKLEGKELSDTLMFYFRFEENIDLFAKICFPEVVTNKSPEFHNDIYDFLFDESNGALAAPRGHAKSSVTGIIFLIYCIVNKLEKYIVYISENYTKTVQFLDPIRFQFKNNAMLKFIYGDLNPTKSRDDDGRDREDCFDVNGIRVEAVSFEQNLRGFKYNFIRPTLIICDDIENDQRVLNPELRVKDSNKLNKIIIPSLDINGRLKMIGTILHVNSLLRKKIREWKGKIYSAISKAGKILWPDRFSKIKLDKIKKDIGSIAFKQEYLNDPTDNETSLIKREWVEACFYKNISTEDLAREKYEYKVLGVDFAFSDRIIANNSAFASLGVMNDKYFLIQAELKHGMSGPDHMRYIKNHLHPKWKYDDVALEENSIKSITKDLDQYNLPLILYWTGSSDVAKKSPTTADYEFNEKRHAVSKVNLIMRLGAAFENHEFVIPYKTDEDKDVADRILAEVTSFALSDGKLVEGGIHPDYPIAIGYALETIRNLGSIVIDF